MSEKINSKHYLRGSFVDWTIRFDWRFPYLHYARGWNESVKRTKLSFCMLYKRNLVNFGKEDLNLRQFIFSENYAVFHMLYTAFSKVFWQSLFNSFQNVILMFCQLQQQILLTLFLESYHKLFCYACSVDLSESVYFCLINHSSISIHSGLSMKIPRKKM